MQRIINRGLLLAVVVSFSLPVFCGTPSDAEVQQLRGFFITTDELNLQFSNGPALRQLSYGKTDLTKEEWRDSTRKKFAELLKISKEPVYESVVDLRQTNIQGVTIHALVMTIDQHLSIPAYLLMPDDQDKLKRPVMAIHGHGDVEPVIGLIDDYHHYFALELAKDGHPVLAPEIRGFNTLADLARDVPVNRLDYWIGGTHFTAVTDAFLYGESLVGQTVEDLLRWESWLAENYDVTELDVTGISYGGDLALYYPVFSNRVNKIFASGTFGSFSLIFQRCHNAPAHCIPGVLQWMDRSDIAGLNAPRPILFHYGEYDTTSVTNGSATYNGSVPGAMKEIKQIYKAFGAEDAVEMYVTPGIHHEYDIPKLLEYLDE